jgi:hypothetical protein
MALTEPEGTLVNLLPFWIAQDQLRAEADRLDDYVAAHSFWTSYDTKLRESVTAIDQVRKDMEANTGWKPGDAQAASTAFYERVDAGTRSIRTWINGGTADVRQAFTDVVDQLPAKLRALEEHASWLRQQDKVTGTDVVPAPELLTAPRTEKITDLDRGWVRVPDSSFGPIREVITTAVRLRDEVRDLLTRTQETLSTLPPEMWQGPTTLATDQTPGNNPRSTGPGDQPGGPGPTGTPPTGTGPAGTPTGTGPAPGTPGPQTPASSPSTPDTGMPGPAGVDQPTGLPPTGPTGQPPGDQPAPPPGLDPITGGPTATPLPINDPELAGIPSATLPPSQLSPLSPPQSTPVLSTPLPSTLPPLGSTGLPTPSSPVLPPFTTPGSTVDGARTGAVPRGPSIGESVAPPRTGTAPGSPVAGDVPVRPGVGAGGGSTGAGFYPPMVPPMVPPGGGAGAGGVRPGEAEFAGGPIRQRGGRESWRAGLRPGLLGRSGDRDEEWPQESPTRQHDEVLDEELWQVPGAAPVAPSDRSPRRARPWET